jgi:hypothetical protein
MPYEGSHKVEEKGSKVVIRDLELFQGYDPSIDEGDPEMASFDRDRVRRIVDRTKRHIAKGSFPRLVRHHEGAGKDVPRVADGMITSVRYEERNGVPFIVGDVEMSRGKFEALIASNEYPRRSAEIWKSGHMSEVALLGRETPRRPLPDTRFSRVGDRMVFAMPDEVATRFTLATREPFTPAEGAIRKKKRRKDSSDMDEISTLKNENARLRNELESLRAEVAKRECETKSVMAKAEADKTEMAKSIEALTATVKELSAKASDAECERLLMRLESDGYAFGADVREKLKNQLLQSSDRGALVELWRQTFRRLPSSPIAGGYERQTIPTDGKVTAEDVIRFQKESGGDPAKFRAMLAKATGVS